MRSLLAFLFLCLPFALATVYYVDPVFGSDSNSGTSPAAAFQTLQFGLDQTPMDGILEIHLLPGDNTINTLDGPTSGISTVSIICDYPGQCFVSCQSPEDSTNVNIYFSNLDSLQFYSVIFRNCYNNETAPFQIFDVADVLVQSCIITNGTSIAIQSAPGGLKISNAQNATLVNTTVSFCSSIGPSTADELFGGGVQIFNSTVITVTGCTFMNNTAMPESWTQSSLPECFGAGLAITINSQPSTTSIAITDSSFLSNSACTQGGGLSIFGAASTTFQPSLSITECLFESNSVYRNALSSSATGGIGGGGLAILYVSPVISLSAFASNTATSKGLAHGAGAMLFQTYTFLVEDSLFEYNNASGLTSGAAGNGGGLSIVAATGINNVVSGDVEDTIFLCNSASTGGGIYEFSANSAGNAVDVNYTDCFIAGNLASTGGGIALDAGGTRSATLATVIDDSILILNQAATGAALWCHSAHSNTINTTAITLIDNLNYTMAGANDENGIYNGCCSSLYDSSGVSPCTRSPTSCNFLCGFLPECVRQWIP